MAAKPDEEQAVSAPESRQDVSSKRDGPQGIGRGKPRQRAFTSLALLPLILAVVLTGPTMTQARVADAEGSQVTEPDQDEGQQESWYEENPYSLTAFAACGLSFLIPVLVIPVCAVAIPVGLGVDQSDGDDRNESRMLAERFERNETSR